MKVEILEDGLHAKELNKYPEPNHLDYKHHNEFGELVFLSDYSKGLYADNYEIWQQAEQSRKVYEIGNTVQWDGEERHVNYQSSAGTIHEAELLPNGKVKIL